MSEYFTYTDLLRGSLARASEVNQRFQAVETGLALLPASAKLREGRVGFYAAGGTANVLTVTMSPAITVYTAGLTLNLALTATNTGAATLNVNGLGAIAIKRVDGSALAAGDLTTGQIAEVIYDGSVFRLQRQTTAEIASSVVAAAAYAAAAAASAAAAAVSEANAASSATDAGNEASAAAAFAASINPANIVHLNGTETITGAKTFSALIAAGAGIQINGQTLSALTAAGKALAEGANASAQLTSLGFSTYGKTLIDDADASTALSTLGFSTFGKTIIDDADGAAVRTTIAAAGSGAITGSGLTMSTGKLLARTTAATGAVEEVTPSTGLVMSGGNLTVVSPIVAALAADQTMTSVATITGMTGALTPGQYELECLGEYKCSSTGTGFEPAFTISGVTGTVNASAFMDVMSNSAVITSGGTSTLAGAGDIALLGANVASNATFYGFKMKAHVFVDAGGAATFAFRGGSVDGVSTITIRKGTVSLKRVIA